MEKDMICKTCGDKGHSAKNCDPSKIEQLLREKEDREEYFAEKKWRKERRVAEKEKCSWKEMMGSIQEQGRAKNHLRVAYLHGQEGDAEQAALWEKSADKAASKAQDLFQSSVAVIKKNRGRAIVPVGGSRFTQLQVAYDGSPFVGFGLAHPQVKALLKQYFPEEKYSSKIYRSFKNYVARAAVQDERLLTLSARESAQRDENLGRPFLPRGAFSAPVSLAPSAAPSTPASPTSSVPSSPRSIIRVLPCEEEKEEMSVKAAIEWELEVAPKKRVVWDFTPSQAVIVEKQSPLSQVASVVPPSTPEFLQEEQPAEGIFERFEELSGRVYRAGWVAEEAAEKLKTAMEAIAKLEATVASQTKIIGVLLRMGEKHNLLADDHTKVAKKQHAMAANHKHLKRRFGKFAYRARKDIIAAGDDIMKVGQAALLIAKGKGGEDIIAKQSCSQEYEMPAL